MFDYISGQIEQLSPTSATVDVNGVGYLINISLQTKEIIEPSHTTKQSAKLYIHYHVNGQDYTPTLYGFATVQERALFRLLISVSGVGSNTARIMLSSYSTADLANIIATGNVAAIQKTKGIGAKTAERVVLDLKGKVLSISELDGNINSSSSSFGVTNETVLEAISALTILGFNKIATEKVVRKVFASNPDLSTEDIIRQSLTLL